MTACQVFYLQHENRLHHFNWSPRHATPFQIGSFAELDKLTTDNKDKLIVVDYSTTWCGPCKMILPKFEALAEEYSDAIFVKVGLM